jgi:microcystin degradation protein MlrC
MRVLVNKSSVHFRADFGGIAEEIIVARAPGPFTADPSQLPWRNLKVGMRTGPNGPAFTAPASLDSGHKIVAQPNAVRSVAE